MKKTISMALLLLLVALPIGLALGGESNPRVKVNSVENRDTFEVNGVTLTDVVIRNSINLKFYDQKQNGRMTLRTTIRGTLNGKTAVVQIRANNKKVEGNLDGTLTLKTSAFDKKVACFSVQGSKKECTGDKEITFEISRENDRVRYTDNTISTEWMNVYGRI